MQEHLDLMERRLVRFSQKLKQLRDDFKQKADYEADSADALKINGFKLYNREELNVLYQDMIEHLAGASEGSQSRYEIGLNQICSTMSEDVLRDTSFLWKQTRAAGEVMQLFDITQLHNVHDDDFKEILLFSVPNAVRRTPRSLIFALIAVPSW